MAHRYAGETFAVYVGRSTGRGANLASHSFVWFGSEHSPGKATIVVNNVPGVGSLQVHWRFPIRNKCGQANQLTQPAENH